MGFVFADVKPFAVIVRWFARGGINLHEPRIISLLKFGPGVLPHFLQFTKLISQLMPFDGFPRFHAQPDSHAPFLFSFTANVAPPPALESIYLVEPFDGCQVEE